MAYDLHFYDLPDGGPVPARDWLDGLTPAKQEAARHALTKVLAVLGTGVCESEWGKALGQGLYEFRIRHDANEVLRDRDPALFARIGPLPAEPTLLRVFFSVEGGTVLLLLAGYDKGADPSGKRQDKEIKKARRYLAEYRRRKRRSGGSAASFRHWWVGRARRR